MLDMSVVDDRPAVVSSEPGGTVKPSPAKSLRKTKSSEAEGLVTVNLQSDGSTYFDLSFVNGVAESLLLPADHKRLAEIGLVQTVEWSMAHVFQV